MRELAEEFDVANRTIRSDITILTREYPLETTRGNGGGVKLADWYKPHRRVLSQKHIDALERGILSANADDAEAFREILRLLA